MRRIPRDTLVTLSFIKCKPILWNLTYYGPPFVEKSVQLKPAEDQIAAGMGASSGIGRETAHPFARRGARVPVAARSTLDLASLVGETRPADGQATVITVDVRDGQALAIYGITVHVLPAGHGFDMTSRQAMRGAAAERALRKRKIRAI